MNKRILSLLLCLVMCFGVLPATAHAEDEPTVISVVDIVDVVEPVHGRTPSPAGYAGTPGVHVARSIKWMVETENGNFIAHSGAFEAGKTYLVDIPVEADEGYIFADTVSAGVNFSQATFGHDTTGYFITIAFVCQAMPENTVITALDVKVSKPEVGHHPDFAPGVWTTPDAARRFCGIDPYNTGWYCLDSPNGSGTAMTENDVFMPGKYYRFEVGAKTQGAILNGWKCAENILCTINDSTKDSLGNLVKTRDFGEDTCFMAAMWKMPEESSETADLITGVDVTVPKPVPGKKCSEIGSTVLAEVPANSIESKTDYWFGENGDLTVPFEAGKTYTLVVAARAKEGYDFEYANHIYTGNIAVHGGTFVSASEGEGEILIEIKVKCEEPREPEDPTNPDNPTKPDDPTKPEDPTKPANPDKPVKPNKPAKPAQPAKPSSPNTADSSNLFLWAVLLFVCGAAFAGTTLLNIRKRNRVN